MKKLFALLLVLFMASLASATVRLVDEGTAIYPTPGTPYRLYVTSDTGLIALDCVATVVGGDIFSGATGPDDAGIFGWDPGMSFYPIGIGTAVVEIGLSSFGAPPSGVVGYFDIFYTGGTQIISIANGTNFGGSADTSFLTPNFSAGTVDIPFGVPEPATCWDIVNECAGMPFGDATCDGAVNLGDLLALKSCWGQLGPPWRWPCCCADFNQDGKVDLGDLIRLKAGWGQGGYSPSTNNQTCP
ncbi:MAG: dockerin type I repeat-containing protein [Planctomycetota bacterium]|jgi:hypothetical protein